MLQVPHWLRPWSPPENTTNSGTTPVASPNEPDEVGMRTFDTHVTQLMLEDGGSDDWNKKEAAFYRNGPSWAIPMTGASIGFVAGFYTAAKRAGLVFMAENAHRRPDTVQGWYFYNKTKNYKVLLGGARGGMRTALRVGGWTSAYVAVESAVRYVRDQEAANGEAARPDADPTDSMTRMLRSWNDRWVDGAIAGLTVAGTVSLLYRLQAPVARRVVVLGFLTGTSIGLLRQVQARLVDAREEELVQQ